jgi:hypothetical protein
MASVSAKPKLISFADIVHGREANVRVTDDGLIYAVDLVMVMTGLSRDDSGKTIRRLPDEIFPSDRLSERNLPGKGNAHTKLATFQHAIELVMVLPGKIAKETRTKFADVITRYYAGDGSLVLEIKANAASNNPINVLARAALVEESSEELEYNKKRKRELEDIEICERRLALERGQIELDLFKIKAPVDFVIHCMSTIETMCGGLEDRDKLRYKALLNISADSQAKYLTASYSMRNEETEELPKMPTPTSISDIVAGMKISGLKGSDYQRIGKIAKRMYMASHNGEVPTQHNQQGQNGQWFKVNDYYLETDEQMLQDAVNEFMASRRC